MSDLLARALQADAPWEPFRPGVEILRIYQSPEGASAALLRYAPGAKVSLHTHTGFEHIYLLAGSQADARGTYVVGTLIINPPGSSHEVTSPGGCIILGIWERPVAFTETSH